MDTIEKEVTADPARVLERLLVLCAAGAAGYRRAAEVVKEPARLHQTLARAATQREEIATVLTSTLVGLGHEPKHHGSIEGAVHRGLLAALAAFAPDAPRAIEAILHECERGEQKTIEAFTRALGRSLPEDVHAVVQAQLGRVLTATILLRSEIAFVEETLAHATP